MELVRSISLNNCPLYNDTFLEWVLLYSRFAVLQLQFFLYGISIIYGDRHTFVFGIACTIDTLIIYLASNNFTFENYFHLCGDKYLLPSFIAHHFSFFVFSLLIHVLLNNTNTKLKSVFFVLFWYQFTLFGEILLTLNNLTNILLSICSGIIFAIYFQILNYILFAHYYYDVAKIKANK